MADVNLGEARQFDYDTGGGVDLVEVSGIVVPASGAAIAVGGILESGVNAVGALAVGGGTPHDSVDSGYPQKIGGYASAAAPTSVAGADRVNAWFLLNGAQATVITAAGALIGGDATNGLDVDVTRLPALVAGSANIGDVDVLTVPADPFGANADASSATGSISAKLRFIAVTGHPITGTVTVDSELPPAAALADATANPTVPGVGAFNEAWNGTTWDRLVTIVAKDAAPNTDTGILAVGAGPGWDRKTNPTGVAATSTANAVTVVTDGADVMQFHVTTIGTTPGSMIFETTGDDSNWTVAGFVLKLSAGPDARIEGAFVPAVNDVYMVRTTGVRQVRYRVNAVYASGTATVKVTSSLGVGLIKGIDMPPPPHNFGYNLVGVSAQYTSAQTSTTIGPTVSSTQRMVVTYMLIGAGGTVAATQVSVYFGTGAFSRGTSKAIFDHELAPSATLKPGFGLAPPVPWMGAADEELKITSVGAANPLTVTIWYYLVTA